MTSKMSPKESLLLLQGKSEHMLKYALTSGSLDVEGVPFDRLSEIVHGMDNGCKRLCIEHNYFLDIFISEKNPPLVKEVMDSPHFDISNMSEMFAYSEYNHPLPFNTSNVTDMSQMFECSIFNYPLVFDTRKVVNMSGMFKGSKYNRPLYFDTSEVINFSCMFMQSNFNQSLDFDISNAINVSNMFSGMAMKFTASLSEMMKTLNSDTHFSSQLKEFHEENENTKQRLSSYFDSPDIDVAAELIDEFWWNEELVEDIKQALIVAHNALEQESTQKHSDTFAVKDENVRRKVLACSLRSGSGLQFFPSLKYVRDEWYRTQQHCQQIV